jgi:ribosomal protein S18 acetylase RimI-like enzyme
MRIEPATVTDLAAIRAAYGDGRAMQRAQRSVVWPEFTEAALMREVEAQTLFCVRLDSAVVGVFSMLPEDALIWGADERGQHLYLHRIARTASYRGGGLVDAILGWARQACVARGRAGLRMDTWAGNDALIAYYVSRGFRQLRSVRLPVDPQLAEHYHGIELALLESPLQAVAE